MEPTPQFQNLQQMLDYYKSLSAPAQIRPLSPPQEVSKPLVQGYTQSGPGRAPTPPPLGMGGYTPQPPPNPLMAQGPSQPPVGAGGPGKPGELGTPPGAAPGGPPLPPARPPQLGAPGAQAGVPLPPPDPRGPQTPPWGQFGFGPSGASTNKGYETAQDFQNNDAARRDPSKGPPPPGAGIFDFFSSGAMSAFKNPGQVEQAADKTGTNPITSQNGQPQEGDLMGPDSLAAKALSFLGSFGGPNTGTGGLF